MAGMVDINLADVSIIAEETKPVDQHAEWRKDAAERLDIAFSRTILTRIDEMYRYEEVSKTETEKAASIGDVAASLSDSSDTLQRAHSVAGLLLFKPKVVMRMIEVLLHKGLLKHPSSTKADQGRVVLTMQGTAYLEDRASGPTGVLDVVRGVQTPLLAAIEEERRFRDQAELEAAAKRAAERAEKAAEKARAAAEKLTPKT